MTAFTTFAALTPVMYATGRGADVARAMALPVFFGMAIELVSLFVVPVLYCGYMEMRLNLRMPEDRGMRLSDGREPLPTEPLEPAHVT
jgi:Cu(I)/Ag(I) efflux system membrane protein CusA/SilA